MRRKKCTQDRDISTLIMLIYWDLRNKLRKIFLTTDIMKRNQSLHGKFPGIWLSKNLQSFEHHTDCYITQYPMMHRKKVLKLLYFRWETIPHFSILGPWSISLQLKDYQAEKPLRDCRKSPHWGQDSSEPMSAYYIMCIDSMREDNLICWQENHVIMECSRN